MLTSVTQWYKPRGRLTVDELIAVFTELSFAMLGASPAQLSAGATRIAAGIHKAVNGPDGAADTVTHSLDLGSHVLHISVARQPKARKTADLNSPDGDEPALATD